ncbi:hypothetical protein KDN32_13995 [Nocardioides sp. J2M5]|uniref:hypothetical protein n=1 Tax=Nocardioides palaemonis TaxID=2829810 RepID=UPI001BAA8D1B|nr:hypothetical protein [Nocardioides palaemonis]MBS2938850.1 hypothetical protein [Nocardioides palaemonis]
MTAVLHPTEPDAGVDELDPRGVAVPVAMAWSAAAGLIHLLVAPAHLAEAWWLGTAFVVVGVAQVALAVLLRWVLPVWLTVLAVAGNTVVVAAYVATRTVDLWFMPAHGPGHEVDHLPVAGGRGNGIPIYPGDRIEAVGPLDLTCLVAELVLVAMLLVVLPARVRSRVGTALAATAVLGAAAVALV